MPEAVEMQSREIKRLTVEAEIKASEPTKHAREWS